MLLPCLILVASAMAGTSHVSPARAALPTVSQQADRLDVGSFTLVMNEQRVGREQFSMHAVKSADGVAFELRAESAVGDRRAAVRLESDSAGTPIRYSLEERTGANVTLRLGGQRVRGRFATLSRSTTGEAAREYLLVAGALVVEDDGLLQYAMVIRHPVSAVGVAATIPILTPTANRQATMQLVLESVSDTVAIAGSKRVARRWRLVMPGGEARIVWADADDRLLRVQIPSRKFDALRDDVPR